MRNVEDTFTANLHQNYGHPLSTQIREVDLDSAVKESQTSNMSIDPDGSHPLMLPHIGTFFNTASLKLLTSVYMQAPTIES